METEISNKQFDRIFLIVKPYQVKLTFRDGTTKTHEIDAENSRDATSIALSRQIETPAKVLCAAR